ncbi:hypothetical protein, conserved [Babesia bigemina]|uniref:MHD domain-containing protein n=1 Tax=Babesia bigemina TaxID=5866 RepID=A0A061D1M4_BABBI|nr:hypothetical protein, conserved [Babesia bigemina]CDR94027.1 hypothetical protein, conserved [Babesia bigemina]|eukprot:XP_012766213.1 hypothetical protein, conserved [Babesia bigemina]
MALSHFFVISSCGDRLLLRSLRGEGAEGSVDEFYSAVTERGEDARPVFKLSDVLYYHVKRYGLYFVATTSFAVPPSFVFELINRIIAAFKDFCGTLSEESMRRNFVLAYEVLDEILDFGYVQCTNTSQLKQKVYNVAVMPATHSRPVVSLAPAFVKLRQVGMRSNALAYPMTLPSVVSQRPLAGGSTRGSEIFVDVVEKLSAVLGADETYRSVTVDGHIQVKSFLRGSPPVKLALNEGIVINSRRGKVPNVPVLDFCNLHQSVDTSEFEKSRVLSFTPMEGEFTLMTYRMSGSAVLPFKVKAAIELNKDSVVGAATQLTSMQASVTINVFCSINQNLDASVTLRCPVPRATSDATLSVMPPDAGTTSEYRASEHALLWTIKRFRGGTGMSFKAALNFAPQAASVSRREFGPINVAFEVPKYCVSNVHVRYMRVMQPQSSAQTYRWVRYITLSNSYLCRF